MAQKIPMFFIIRKKKCFFVTCVAYSNLNISMEPRVERFQHAQRTVLTTPRSLLIIVELQNHKNCKHNS